MQENSPASSQKLSQLVLNIDVKTLQYAMTKKTKLELTWIGKDQRPRLEPRVLLEDPEKSYHAQHKVTDNDQFDNRLIYGDNLLALKALEQEFAGKIKCIYIDPPFNTGQAFENYDDGLEHSIWLGLMHQRLSLLHRLLRQDGTLFVHIDDNQLGYLIVILDEIFGRNNRLYVVTFKQGSATGHKAINPGCVSTSNFVLIYAKDKSHWTPNRVFTERGRDTRYNQFLLNPHDDYRKWQTTTLTLAYAKSEGISEAEARKIARQCPGQLDEFVVNHAENVIRLARPDYNGVSAAARELIDESREHPDEVYHLERDSHSDIYLKGGERFLFYKGKMQDIDGRNVTAEPLTTIWDDILSNNLHKEGGVRFPKGKKPEHLVKRVLELCTEPNDWVLDSFAGSGTTGAVAHKMGRRWIMIELGEHCHTHIIPRLKRVVSGENDSGITNAVDWMGGGGFRYFTLAPSLLEQDQFGNWIINKKYNAEMLAQAICKIEGFTYAPSDSDYWQHGYSTESDFIYVTTQNLTRQQIEALAEDVGPNRSLVVMCSAYRIRKVDDFPNLTLKKIPKTVLSKCEWGKDDYSLEVQELPPPPEEEPQAPPPPRGRKRIPDERQNTLFAMEGEA